MMRVVCYIVLQKFAKLKKQRETRSGSRSLDFCVFFYFFPLCVCARVFNCCFSDFVFFLPHPPLSLPIVYSLLFMQKVQEQIIITFIPQKREKPNISPLRLLERSFKGKHAKKETKDELVISETGKVQNKHEACRNTSHKPRTKSMQTTGIKQCFLIIFCYAPTRKK